MPRRYTDPDRASADAVRRNQEKGAATGGASSNRCGSGQHAPLWMAASKAGQYG
jgi:hypothetical protein